MREVTFHNYDNNYLLRELNLRERKQKKIERVMTYPKKVQRERDKR